MATKKTPKAELGWSDVKTQLADVDRAGLMRLVRDLYAASKDNRAFLHARLGLGDDPLEPYKDRITDWISPQDFRDPISVSRAKKAISDYKKALGKPEDLAELTVFFCEEVFNLLAVCGMEDESFYDARCGCSSRPCNTFWLCPKRSRRHSSAGSTWFASWGRTSAGAWAMISTTSGRKPAW